MGIDEIVRSRRGEILALAEKYGVTSIRVFGSVARGTADEKSDLDLLVEVKPGTSLFDLGGLLYDLEKLLGRSVDIVTPAGLRQRLRQRVMDEAIPL